MKLFDPVRDIIRKKQYSIRTGLRELDETIHLFHDKRQSKDVSVKEASARFRNSSATMRQQRRWSILLWWRMADWASEIRWTHCDGSCEMLKQPPQVCRTFLSDKHRQRYVFPSDKKKGEALIDTLSSTC